MTNKQRIAWTTVLNCFDGQHLYVDYVQHERMIRGGLHALFRKVDMKCLATGPRGKMNTLGKMMEEFGSNDLLGR